MTAQQLWQRFQDYLCHVPKLSLTLDISRVSFDDSFLAKMEKTAQKAFQEMVSLEKGAIANPDENRMVGHYWLRNPALAPTPELKTEIDRTNQSILQFAHDVHSGKIAPAKGGKFTQLLSIGIGGSALGPMFVADALGDPQSDRMKSHFIDNTDPDGIARVLRTIGTKLDETLVVVISKSGGTPEPRNGMLMVEEAFRENGLAFAKSAVAITGTGSNLDQYAKKNGWLTTFPMWDWVGGRTSELSTVGLVPAALQGFAITEMLQGAEQMDEATRIPETRKNPAMLLALSWYHTTNGKGEKDMVVLPYKDRLLLFSRYLQQLVMESLGKRLDLSGKRVDQGIAVYGNKGSTDQHAYVQQLRDGVNNFFVVFLRVLQSGGKAFEVEPGVTAGDYLHGFLLGTREALFQNERQSVTISIPTVNAFYIGALIALFERAVGFYASFVGINAYHQPGVEAGKKAAAAVLSLQNKVVAHLSQTPQTAVQIADAIGHPEAVETIYFLLQHLTANLRAVCASGTCPATESYRKV